MSRYAGQSQISFSDTFFRWFYRQEMVYSEYPYAGMDFQGDLDLVLPASEQWGVIGKFSDHISIHRFFYNVLVLSSIRTNQNSCAHADIGPVQTVVRLRVLAAAPAGEAMGRAILHDHDVAETISSFQDQVEGITLGIPNVRTDELPLRLQRHSTGVPSQWTTLLRMITHAVTCYHQHY